MRPTTVCRRGSRRLSGGAARTPAGPGPLPTSPESPQPGGRIFWRLVGLLSAIQHMPPASRCGDFPCPAAALRRLYGRPARTVWGASVSRSRLSVGGRRASCHIRKRGRILRCNLLVFEPKPRFELGTPSLRVKCSTAELFRPGKTSCLLSDCKYLKKILFLQQFCKKSLISSYLRI